MAWKMTSVYFMFAIALLTMVFTVACGGGVADSGVGSLAQGRWSHSATILEDGRVLVTGGHGTSSNALTSAEVYDPSTNAWSSAGDMADKHPEGHTTTLLPNGKVLVIGGKKAPEVYDPSANSWSTTELLTDPRMRHTATLLDDGRVLVTGGRDMTKAGDQKLDSVELYDPSTGEWSLATPMLEERLDHGAALLPDGKVLVVSKYGGNLSHESSAETYDPSTETWSPAGAPLKERDSAFTITATADGKVIVTGGRIFTRGRTQAHVMMSDVDIYDSSTGTWSVGAPMTEVRVKHAAVLLPDGKVLVVGRQDAESYDLASGAWVPAGEMTRDHIEGVTGTLLKDGRVLIVGGRQDSTKNPQRLQVGGTGMTAAEIYDPASGWSIVEN